MWYASHNSVIVCKPPSCSNTNRIRSSTTLLAFQGILPFYTPCQLAVSGMSPVQSVRNLPGLYPPVAQAILPVPQIRHIRAPHTHPKIQSKRSIQQTPTLETDLNSKSRHSP